MIQWRMLLPNFGKTVFGVKELTCQEKVCLDLNELGIIRRVNRYRAPVALFDWLTWQKNKGKKKHVMLLLVSFDVWY